MFTSAIGKKILKCDRLKVCVKYVVVFLSKTVNWLLSDVCVLYKKCSSISPGLPEKFTPDRHPTSTRM